MSAGDVLNDEPTARVLGTKIVYLYDGEGLYVGGFEAQESPLDEPGIFLVPDLSTDQAPVLLAGTWPVYKEGMWVNEPDYRGQIYYNQDGSTVIIEVLGTVPAGLLSSPPLPTLVMLQATKNNELVADYNAAIQSPVDYMSTVFQADETSQSVLSRILSVGSVPGGFYWIDSNNNQIPMTYAQLQGLAMVVLVQAQAAFDRLQARKSSVRLAVSLDDLEGIIW